MADNNTGIKSRLLHYAPVAGLALIIGGILLFLDQRIHTGWLTILLPVFIGLMLVIYGLFQREYLWVVTGIIISGLGFALIVLFGPFIEIPTKLRIGIAIALVAFSLMMQFLVDRIWKKRFLWGILIVALVAIAVAFSFISARLGLLDFVFHIALAIGITLLAWGIAAKKLGLIIPAVLVGTIGAGVYYGWSDTTAPGGLQKTGIMLVWFSLGWLLITVFSRVIMKKFIWWSLIPGGILLTTGAGLYIGGNPGNALGFLGNTGSVGLILIGVYLILLKFGMKK
jgi:hypothetical protein